MPKKKQPERRRKGQGTIVHRKDGRWMVRVPFPTKDVYDYADTEVEAELRRRELVLLRETGQSPNRDRLEVVLQEWLDSRSGKIADSTLKRYRQIVNLYLIPRLGAYVAGELTPREVQTLLNSLNREGVGARQQQYVYKTLRTAYNWMLRMRLVGENPVIDVEQPVYVAPEAQHLTPSEVQRLIDLAESDPRGPVWVTMVLQGLRPSEALGLSWNYVDLSDGVLSVRQQLSPEGTGQLTTLKTKSSARNLPLHPRVQRILEDLWHIQGQPSSGFVFVTKNRTPFSQRNLARDFDKFQERYGLRRIKLHELRHTMATLLGRARVEPRTTMEMLGHRDLEQTLKVYTHSDLDMMRRALRDAFKEDD